MRSGVIGGWGAALLLSAIAAGTGRGEPVEDGPAGRADALVGRLGADTFARREEASRALVDLGEAALPAVRRAAAGHKDPEVRARAAAAVLAILRAARTSQSTGLEMATIEPGEFRMGEGERAGTNRVAHQVRITSPFLMGIHEVTQDQYRLVMKADPAGFAKGGDRAAKVEGTDTGGFPVERVSWFDAIEFCNRLGALDGHPPCYEMADVRREGGSIADARVTIVGGGGYRLPTEAQWEYACRAGTTGRHHYGERNTGAEANLKPYSPYSSSPRYRALDRTARVGSYPANAWGLFDMHGNVAEWCWDLYDAHYYEKSPPDDPQGPVLGEHQVVRGGSWLDDETACRSASRFWLTPDERKDYAGFRVARIP